VYSIAQLFAAGISTGISTDFSVSPLELSAPLTVMKMAMQSPHSPLTWEQVLQGLTSGSAATVPQRDIGSLAVGCWADMVVFDHDLATVIPTQLDDSKVVKRLSTWVGGRRVA
ncbi:MAG: amidohydrolase family protein, partial [Syntrophales bacterium]|nr:amidohydrolase family protein [Syntrophales bacterium]